MTSDKDNPTPPPGADPPWAPAGVAAGATGPDAVDATFDDLVEDFELDGGGGPFGATGELTVEQLVELLERTTQERDAARLERDEHLEARARVQAEFENFRRRVSQQQQELHERAAESLVAKLLPSLDAFEAAMVHDPVSLQPVYQAYLQILEREGLGELAPMGQPFDPNCHEAVLREEGEGDENVVVEVLRRGYSWKGRVLRPAMVKVRT